jgi:uncharacterized protein (DUF58 family)
MRQPKLLLLHLLIYGLVLGGLATLNGQLLALALPFIIYLGAGLLYEPEEPRLKVNRTLSANYVVQDEPITIKLTITNEGSGLEEVVVEDLAPARLELLDGQTRLLTRLPPGTTVELGYTLRGKRGAYRFAEAHITASESLGLFQKQRVISAPGQFLVLPEATRLRRVEIRPRRTRVYSGLIPVRQGGPGIEFFGVRAYQPGDLLRWINGRASARHLQTLFVNEFEQERVADVGLILDARRQSDASAPEGSLFEHSIQATAALADTFLNDGNRVGLFIYGRYLDWTLPGYGKVQRQRILLALARAEQGDGDVFATLEHLPTRLFPVRSQLVLISPLLPDDPEILITLRARGYRLLIISPDPVSFERKGLPTSREIELATRLARLERELLLNKLRQASIQVIDWQVETPFSQVAHRAFSRFQ